MKLRYALAGATALAFLAAGGAEAQTAAQPVITGYMSLVGCPSLNQTPCFIQYGASGGGGGTVNQGTAGSSPWLVTDSSVVAAINAKALTPPIAMYPYGMSQYVAVGGTTNALLTNSAVSANGGVAGTLEGYTFYNGGTSKAYIQFFDLPTGSVTLGTTVPKFVVEVAAGAYWSDNQLGRVFSTSITLAATTTATGNGAPATGITIDSLDYR